MSTSTLEFDPMPPSTPMPPLHIFIVENHPDTLLGLTMYLEQEGHTIFSARSMKEALAAMPDKKFDVLLSDIGLPDGDGWELLRQAKLPGTVYTIAMSGFGMNADRIKSKKAGYNAHLLKPFNPEELDRILEEVTRKKMQ